MKIIATALFSMGVLFAGAQAVTTIAARPAAITAVRLRPLQVVVVPDKATALFQKTTARLTPSGKTWLAAQSLALRNGTTDPMQVERLAAGSCTTALGACAGDLDIEALALTVMMQTVADAKDDLRDMMAEVKAANEAKANKRAQASAMRNEQADLRARARAAYARPVRTITAQQLNADVAKLKSDLDSMSEMGEMESLRLQMAMDRLSKMMSALSNILKKISDTEQGIIKNLK